MERLKELKEKIHTNEELFNQMIKDIENTSFDFGVRIGRIEAKYPEFKEFIELIVAFNDIANTNNIEFKNAIEDYSKKHKKVNLELIDILIEEKLKNPKKPPVISKIGKINLKEYQNLIILLIVLFASVTITFNSDKIIEILKVYGEVKNVEKSIK